MLFQEIIVYLQPIREDAAGKYRPRHNQLRIIIKKE